MAKERPQERGRGHRGPRPRFSPAGRLAAAWGLLAMIGLLATLAAACGGEGEPQPEASPTPSPAAEEAALTPCQALRAFNTYRYSASLKLESPEPGQNPPQPPPTPVSTLTRQFTGPFLFEYNIEASFVAPDRTQALITTPGSPPLSTIVIGPQTWIEMEGQWQPRAYPYDIPYKPPDVCEAILPDLDLSQAQVQEEKINNVKTFRYSFHQVHLEQAWAKIYGPGSDLDILLKKLDVDLWLAEKGNWPARIHIRSSGFYGDGRELRAEILIDVKDANSGDIRVEPPT